jgi:hypothetical protein
MLNSHSLLPYLYNLKEEDKNKEEMDLDEKTRESA